jgi:DNA-binding protein YbaB
MLQDLILVACNEASRKVDEQMSSQMGNLAGGLNIPGLI